MQNVIVTSTRIETVLKYFMFYLVGGCWVGGQPVGGQRVGGRWLGVEPVVG